jgi:hypothetical protein
VDRERVKVWMGWAFSVTIARDRIQRVIRSRDVWWAIGLHFTFGHRWIVNGAPGNIVTMVLDPPCRGRVWAIPIKIRQLSVSVLQPDALVQALSPTGHW